MIEFGGCECAFIFSRVVGFVQFAIFWVLLGFGVVGVVCILACLWIWTYCCEFRWVRFWCRFVDCA